MKVSKRLVKNLIILSIIYLWISSLLSEYFIINISPSMPRGIYYAKSIGGKRIEKGSVVVLEIPSNAREIIYSRGYLKRNIKTLLKEVVGSEGDLIEVKNTEVYLNSKYIGSISKVDSKDRELTSSLRSGVIPKGKLFLQGTSKNSYDSKYFGLVDEQLILKKAKLIIGKIEK